MKKELWGERVFCPENLRSVSDPREPRVGCNLGAQVQCIINYLLWSIFDEIYF